MTLRCQHDVDSNGLCEACGQLVPLVGIRILMQPLFSDAEYGGTFTPARMGVVRVTPEELDALIDHPEAAAATLRRLRERNEDA